MEKDLDLLGMCFERTEYRTLSPQSPCFSAMFNTLLKSYNYHRPREHGICREVLKKPFKSHFKSINSSVVFPSNVEILTAV